jgi:hypothetical protein
MEADRLTREPARRIPSRRKAVPFHYHHKISLKTSYFVQRAVLASCPLVGKKSHWQNDSAIRATG